jgi:hypothetical protein
MAEIVHGVHRRSAFRRNAGSPQSAQPVETYCVTYPSLTVTPLPLTHVAGLQDRAGLRGARSAWC